MALRLNVNKCAKNDKCDTGTKPGLRKVPKQIQNGDSDLLLDKTKSKTETQSFETKPNPNPRLRFGSKQNQIQNRNSALVFC